MTGPWYVVLEEETKNYASIDGHGYDLYRWHLARTTEGEGTREAAEAAARSLADSHVPDSVGRFLYPGARPGRQVYRMPDGTLLVRLTRRYDETRFRVSVGELIAVQEEVEGERLPEAPSGLKRLFGRGRP
ncbi:hypothetical protein [Kitasatospora purpeofusca]|uniref:hypothetical protein n=1 Tax=Kitasatospora purpeofusca TaxID=67352 RepID=UPI0004C11341|nr:hypothetical protein [Kitasatospora purpeofusca]